MLKLVGVKIFTILRSNILFKPMANTVIPILMHSLFVFIFELWVMKISSLNFLLNCEIAKKVS